MSKKILISYFENFYTLNRSNKCCFNSEEIKNRVKKCVDTTFAVFSSKIEKEIGFSKILLGIGGSFIFTKDNFYALEWGIFSCKIHKYKFEELKYFSGNRNVLKFKSVKFSLLPFRDNALFDLLNKIQNELPAVIKQELEANNKQYSNEEKIFEEVKPKKNEGENENLEISNSTDSQESMMTQIYTNDINYILPNLSGFTTTHLEIFESKYNEFSESIKAIIIQSGIFKHTYEATKQYDRYETYRNFREKSEHIGVLYIPHLVICIGDKNRNFFNDRLQSYMFEIHLHDFHLDLIYFPINAKQDGKIFSSFEKIVENSSGNETTNYLEVDINDISRDNLPLIDAEYELLKKIIYCLNEFITETKKKVGELNDKQNSVINKIDSDGDGKIDLLDGESFNKLLNKYQKSIIDFDKNYIQKFVKISLYLKTKKSNTQKIFDSISKTKNENELNELANLLRNQIHTYELLLLHSISMITSLVNNDLITFYEIYECFDQLGVFNSSWENEISNKLTNIGDGIKDLMYSIHEMESRLVKSIENLSYITEDSFRDLRHSIESELSSVNSSIGFNNLLTGIQTYQLYKINKNTKRIN